MIQISIIGNLGRDVETVMLNDQPVTKLTVAANRQRKQPGGTITEETTWFSCLMNRCSDQLKQFLVKGKRVYIQGDLRVRIYQTGNGQSAAGLDVQVSRIELC